MAEWTNKNVIRLIEMLHERDSLWNLKHRMYKDRNTRHDLLMEIAISFGLEKEEIERKLKNLYCHFTREIKKEEMSLKFGSGTDSVYKSKWFAYQSMTFLKDKHKPQILKDKHKPHITFKIEDEQSQEQLIILVQGYNELYDTSDPDYRNQLRREFIWGEIGKIMDKSGSECEENWRILREDYWKSIVAQDPLDQSASSDRPYKFSKSMSFMRSHLLQREQRGDYSMEEVETPCIIYFDELDERKTDKKNSNTLKRKTKSTDNFREDTEYKKNKPSSAGSFTEDTECIQTKPNSTDHLAKYFQSVEETCRTLTPQLQIMVKTQISQIIHQAELENLNLPTSSANSDNL